MVRKCEGEYISTPHQDTPTDSASVSRMAHETHLYDRRHRRRRPERATPPCTTSRCSPVRTDRQGCRHLLRASHHGRALGNAQAASSSETCSSPSHPSRPEPYQQAKLGAKIRSHHGEQPATHTCGDADQIASGWTAGICWSPVLWRFGKLTCRWPPCRHVTFWGGKGGLFT